MEDVVAEDMEEVNNLHFYFLCFTTNNFVSGGFISYWIFIPLVVLICCCSVCLCHQKDKGEPSQSNQMFITSDSKDVERDGEHLYLSNAFQSGIWSCRYYQYSEWHGPHLLTLHFDNTNMTIKGSGTDDIGTFTVDGIYSESTRRIGLTEHYQYGTGDPTQNLGHDVTIQVEYNSQSNQFEGKWYVKTQKYQGENQIEFKFVEPYA